jgi:hypothetical protein
LHAARSDQSRLSARRAATSGVGAVAAEAAGMGKTTVLLFLGFVAAGCHAGPCGGCAEWETCDVTTDQCTLNAGTRFDLVADDGNVPGDSWDPFFGPPDPYICVSSTTDEGCSSIQSDDSSPTWNDTVLSNLDGSALLTTTLGFDYEDSDLDSPDLICSSAVTLTAADLHAGGFRFNCSNGSSARFTLKNTNRGTPTVATH